VNRLPLRLPLDNLHSAAMVVVEDDQIVATNPAFDDLAGLDGSLPTIEELFDEENQEEFRGALRQMRGHHDKIMVGINLRHTGLNMRLLMTAIPITAKRDEDAALLVFSRGEGDSSIYTDFLTKLPNRQEAAIRLRYEWNRAVRSGNMFSLALADIDHFKNVNDTLGHEAGDHVLVHVAGVLSDEIRGSDWCARWGGEEFMILLTDSTAQEGEFVLNRVRSNLLQNPPMYQDNPVPVTLSFGLVSKGAAYKSYRDMVNDADVLLYESKTAGRNRITLFETQGTAVAWNRKEIAAVVEDRVIRPSFRAVRSKTGRPTAFEITPTHPTMDLSQTRRLWQSADGLGLLKDLQVQIMQRTMEAAGEAGGEKEFLLPMPVRLATDSGFLSAVEKAGIEDVSRFVLVLDGKLELKDDAQKRLHDLRRRGFRLAVRDVEFNTIPIKFLTEQDVSYMFVRLDEVMRGEADGKHPIMKGLLENIIDGGTKLIAVRHKADHKAGGEFADMVEGYLFRGEPPQSLEAASA